MLTILAPLLIFLPMTLTNHIRMLPVNPCPDVFNYVLMTGRVAGHVTVPNDNSGSYELTVNMSIARYIDNNQNIRIQMQSTVDDLSSGRPIQYFVIFPVQDVLPKLTEVIINGQVICTGPPEQLVPGRYVTNMWAKSFFRTTIVASNFIPSGAPIDNTFISNFKPTPVENPFVPQVDPTTRNPPPVPEVRNPTPKPEVKCGIIKSSQNLILGGEATSTDEFPWLAAIMYADETDETNYKLKCTGNLITDRHVITAGHCLRYYNAALIENDNLVIVLGKNDIKNWPLGITRGVKEVHVHPKYNQDSPVSDFVIIELSASVSFSPSVSPICLWEGSDRLSEVVGKQGIVVGWGANKIGTDFSPVPNKIRMPIVSQEQCLRSNRAFRNLTSGNTFCAGNRDGKGPCVGDAGAGFVIQDETSSRWLLRGVAAFSLTDDIDNACDLTNYIVFADAAKEMKWIKSVISS